MKYWQLLVLAPIFVIACNTDDPEPVVVPIPLEDEILGNWEYQTGELYESGKSYASLILARPDDCKLPNDKLAWLIRPIDVRILTDKETLTLIMTECLEKTVEYTHVISYNDYKLTVIDSTIEHSGNPVYAFKWRIRTVSDTDLEMWRVAPEDSKAFGVEGARMLYKFKKNNL